jgi:TolB-like protein/DNA-binding winged helix-turn-helix (wHTH) protein
MPQAIIPSRIFKFGAFEVDLRAGELTKFRRRVRLQEQPFQLLVMLLERPGLLITRDELHLKLWPETTVDFDHGLNKAISKLREALGDSAESPRFIETVARRGYKFLADVSVIDGGQALPEREPAMATEIVDPAPASAPAPPSIVQPATFPEIVVPVQPRKRISVRWIVSGLFAASAIAASLLAFAYLSTNTLPEIRSILVFPLQNLSSDTSQDYFADGMTDELITSLAQIQRLKVIVPPSSVLDKNAPKSLRQIARELHVDAVMTGSVLFGTERVRVTARLIEMPTERDVWAQSYERGLQHTIKTQNEIAHSIAEQLRGLLDRQEKAAQNRPASEKPVADEGQSSTELFWSRRAREGWKRALAHFSWLPAANRRYVDAYSGSADAYAAASRRRHAMLRQQDPRPDADLAAVKAAA